MFAVTEEGEWPARPPAHPAGVTAAELRRTRAALRAEIAARLPALIRRARPDLAAHAIVTDLTIRPEAMAAAGVPADVLGHRLAVRVPLSDHDDDLRVLATWAATRGEADAIAIVSCLDDDGLAYRSTVARLPALPLRLDAPAAAAYEALRNEGLDAPTARRMTIAVIAA